MQALRKKSTLILGSFLMTAACEPQGRVQRVIHPPLDLTGRVSKNLSPKGVPASRTRPGLPIQCRLEVRVKDSFCISCDEEGMDVERCYEFQGLFDDAKNCVYSAEQIKCLNVTPPFALKIAVKGSLEKSLMENVRIWQESVRTIARPQLDPDLQKALEDSLKQTEDLVQILGKARKVQDWVEQSFPQLTPTLKKSLLELQEQKEAGQLKLLQILHVSRLILESQGISPGLLQYWEALSVEGLEEPQD